MLDNIPIDPISFAFGVACALIVFGYWLLRGFQAKNQEEKITDLIQTNASLQTALEVERHSIEKAREDISNHFKALSQEALAQSSESFLKLANERLKAAQGDAAHDLTRRQTAIDEMVKPVKEHLKKLEESLGQIKGTDQSLIEQIQYLQKTTSRIDGALRNPKMQGEWGEKVLEGLLEHSGLIKGVHFETQSSFEVDGQRLRPDAIITLGEGLKIIVDAKAPIHDFSSAIGDVADEAEYKEISKGLANQIRKHVIELRKRSYWEGIENIDFTVMFLPSEHLFSAAIHADPSLVDYAAESKVIIVSPTLMLSLLKVVNFSWRQAELAENAAKISAVGQELHKRLNTFTDHLVRIGKGLNQALGGYDDAVGSFESRVMPQIRQLEDLHVSSTTKTIEAVPKISKVARNVTFLASEDENMDNAPIDIAKNKGK